MQHLGLSPFPLEPFVAFFIILKMLEFYLVFFMVSLVINNTKALQRQLILFFAVSIIVCIYAIISIGTLDRVSAPFESGGTEPNTLGGYLLIVMCVAGGLFCYAPSKNWKILLALIIITGFVPFIMTLSRASYMTLFIAFIAMGIFTRRPLLIAAVALVVIASPAIMPPDVIDRVSYTFQSGGVPLEVAGLPTNIEIDKSTYERVYVWEKVRFNLGVWPWLGGGVSWDTVLDSQYARVLIETGILGMLVSTIGLIVHGLGTISFLIVRIMEPFWLLMALTVVAREIALVDYKQKLKAYQEAQIPPSEPETTLSSQTPQPTTSF